MAEIIEINDIDALAGCRLAVNALLAETPRASFFHTVDWLEAYWKHYGEGQRLRVLVARAAGQTIGVVPLVVRTVASRLGPLRVLTYPLENWGSWYSPLGGNQAATLALALRHLDRTPRDWDLIDLPWTDHAGADRGRTLRAMRGVGWRVAIEPNAEVSEIAFTDGYEDYLASRAKKHRHELRRTRRRVAETAGIEFVRHRPEPLRDGDGDPRWDLYEACEQVAAKSWQAGSTTGNTLTHDDCRGFLRDAHAAASRVGAVDLCLLKAGGRPVAFAYSYHCSGRLFGLRMGYDPQAGLPFGAGKALTSLMIEDSFRRGDAAFEFGEGNEPYKRRLRTGVAQAYRLRHAPLASWRGQASIARRELTRRWARVADVAGVG